MSTVYPTKGLAAVDHFEFDVAVDAAVVVRDNPLLP
jgi:hypothetical protein